MPKLRHRLAALIGLVVVVSMAFFAGGSALAQTGYPPGTTTQASCTPGNVTKGNVAVGQTFTFTLCGNFAPGASVSITVNGAAVLTKTPTGGAVVVVITVVSQTVVQVGDPVNAAAVCGINTVKATGPSAGGGSASPTGTFNLVCTSSSTTNGGGIAFTGANIAKAVLVALALIGAGALLVIFQRRRRQTT